ncbi:MAG: DUF433 domain-containing protein [Saprospiraceae bacterium]|nr:DUF433 domain-containing protein [Saprospiraceae bacterium]
MEAAKLIDRIEINPKVLNGKPVIKGTRLSVQFIIGLLAQGMTMEEVLQEYYRLTKEDILACLEFAAQTLENNFFYPLSASA